MTQLKQSKPDLIYTPVYYTMMVPVARQAKTLGIKGDLFFGGDGWAADNLLEDAGDALQGARVTDHWAADTAWPAGVAFVGRYHGRFGRIPSSLAALGYDSAKLLADAISSAQSDTPASIRDALAATRRFVGATGIISMGADREPQKEVVIVRIDGQKFRYHATVRADPAMR